MASGSTGSFELGVEKWGTALSVELAEALAVGPGGPRGQVSKIHVSISLVQDPIRGTSLTDHILYQAAGALIPSLQKRTLRIKKTV